MNLKQQINALPAGQFRAAFAQMYYNLELAVSTHKTSSEMAASALSTVALVAESTSKRVGLDSDVQAEIIA